MILPLTGWQNYFNPRSREGSDGQHCPPPFLVQNFNPRSREGSDRGAPVICWQKSLFQSTLPRGERQLLLQSAERLQDFNPRSREGSDKLINFSTMIRVISIHAPARGATNIPKEFKGYTVISIHAPARGATYFIMSAIFSLSIFQSTLPRGERPASALTILP